MLRVGKRGNPVLARLEVHDPQLAAAIDELSVPVDRSGRTEQRMRRNIVIWTVAATASLRPRRRGGRAGDRHALTPLVPYPLERRLGEAIDAQVRASLDTGTLGADSNAEVPRASSGRAAFDKLMKQLETAAALPFPLRPAVIRRPEANAVALPGGRIYVFQGLIDKAETPDEVAGVIAHEIGHVAHRDGTRSVLQGAGLSLLFGMLLGDFVGGGAVVIAASTILQTSYSREVEAAADRYGVLLMTKLGGDPRALGPMLSASTAAPIRGSKILLDHPETPRSA